MGVEYKYHNLMDIISKQPFKQYNTKENLHNMIHTALTIMLNVSTIYVDTSSQSQRQLK